jgi:hypothetical protein
MRTGTRLEVEGLGVEEDEDDVPLAVAVRVAPLPHQGQTCVYVNPVTNQLHLGIEFNASMFYASCYCKS